jgi:hypothetical protein
MGQWSFSCKPRRNDAAISGKLKKYLDEQYIRRFFVLFDPDQWVTLEWRRQPRHVGRNPPRFVLSEQVDGLARGIGQAVSTRVP